MAKPSLQRYAKLLERQSETLGRKHQDRLEAMTRLAVEAARDSGSRRAWSSWTLAAGGMAAVVLTVALVLLSPTPRQPETTLASGNRDVIPAWVEDDSVPVSLLENIEFYVWINQSFDADQQG
ncbi:MAG TPA: hypothetical protein ENK26_00375 [Gammaproteobacteria bacterium]|nr:hypothetical protein [Gammaproteobacteria bacterium]